MSKHVTRRKFIRTLTGGVVAGAALGDALEYAVAGQNGDGYRLVWQDEFNHDGAPNPQNWNFENGFVRSHELQWYQPQNACCSGGRLIITGRREDVRNPNYQAGSSDWTKRRRFGHYTSSSLLTKGKHSWRYGLFVMRGRINTHPGSWPALWTIGDHKPWPAGGEIDIMEYYRGHINANVAWQGANGRAKWKSVFKPIVQFHDPNWSDRFHIWAMRWEPDAIRLYLDGKLMNLVALSKTVDPRYKNYNPFHHKAYMRLNLAIGGQAGGDPSHTKFPVLFEVDYVRVYQRS
ncbi:MAG: glycoside hydrolase family 16 protein [Phycisphaerales bacterium]|nr:glycoside hydrolase family 16 protein [Phycisphaerales bacterium]